jgi:hypothetical protein
MSRAMTKARLDAPARRDVRLTAPFAIAAVIAAGCSSGAGLPNTAGALCADDSQCGLTTWCRSGQCVSLGSGLELSFPQSTRNKIDVLFMIDNSPGMDAMQADLKSKFAGFVKAFQDLADQGTYLDLHIGVVTSDYGAGATGAPGCTPSSLVGGGDQGKLQALGKKADPSCVKPKKANYIEYAFGPMGPISSNLPDNTDLLTEFGCMASVGSSGCGFEHQLESVYAALHGNIPENRGFLRDDALLEVIFFTNEDDASAPPDSDIFDKNKVAQYGFEDSYSRQTRFAVQCGDPRAFPPYADSGGPLPGCVPAPNLDGVSGPGKQYGVNRYIWFFNSVRAQGGAKDSPLDVVLIAIDAPEDPFQVLLSNPATPAGQPYRSCGLLDEASNPPCVPVLQHSCVNPTKPSLFGDPAVRLNTVVRSVLQHQVQSICDDDYSLAVKFATWGPDTIGVGCIPKALPRDAMGNLKLDCVVEDVIQNADGTITRNELRQCDATASNIPCWTIDPNDRCAGAGGLPGISPDGVGLTIHRGQTGGLDNPAPPHTTTHLDCAL